jgi:hypothetical protein
LHEWIRRKEDASSPGVSANSLEQGRLRLRCGADPYDEVIEGRIQTWLQPTPINDPGIAKVLSDGPDLVMHYLRYIRYAQATDPNDYNQRKSLQPDDVGLDISELSEQFFEEYETNTKLDTDLKKLFRAVGHQSLATMMDIRSIASSQQNDFGKQESKTVTKLQNLSTAWLKFTVGCLIRARTLKGDDLAGVPLLAPENADGVPLPEEGGDEREIIYPFRTHSRFWLPSPARISALSVDQV